MNKDNYLRSKINEIFFSKFLCDLFRMYQLEKEEGSEFSASVIQGGAAVHNSVSSSKMGITGQQTVR